MIPIREHFEVAAPPDRVWPLLSDPAFVVTCVPGATLVAERGNDTYDGALAVKFGPIVATFKGTAQIRFDHANRGCAIEARGQDGRGASRASASTTVAVTGDEKRTTVSIDGGFEVSGPLGQFARTGGQHLAREMLGEFSRNLAARLAESSQAAAGGGVPPDVSAASARELSGFALIWRALIGWLRGRGEKSTP